MKDIQIDLNKAHNNLFALLTFLSRGEIFQVHFIENHLKQLIVLYLKVFLYKEKKQDRWPTNLPKCILWKPQKSIEKRLLFNEDIDLLSCSKVLDANNWPKM
jgi:hypothetical protein